MWRRIFVVFAKEVIDNSRDRRSLLVALIYPLLGPLLLGLMIAAVVDVVTIRTEARGTLPVLGAEWAPEFVAYLESRGITVTPVPEDAEAAVRDGELKTAVVIPEGFGELFRAGKTATITIFDGADHAFFNDTRAEVYDKVHAATCWSRMLAFYREHVR